MNNQCRRITFGFLVFTLGVAGGTQAGPAPEGAPPVYVIQFIHPGSEHEPDSETGRSWNTGTHRRKFMTKTARYLTALDAKPVEGNVVFWGEWEPPSLLLKTYESPIEDFPRFLFQPVREPFREQKKQPLMNTDPFIYGDKFFYAICKQNNRHGPTSLQRLGKGSVILFGSGKHRSQFVLDTVFVIADYSDYNIDNYREVLKDKVPPEYFEVSLDPISYEMKVRGPAKTFRLYIGATYDHPFEGMFSFFPCRPGGEKDAQGFARPAIRRKGIITDNLTQGERFNPQPDVKAVRDLWLDVAGQVLAQGLSLGVHTDIPPKH